MDIFYAIGMNITKKACVKHGQTDDTGKKFAKFGEVIEKMKLAAAEPDNSGNYHDYVELCKLYDKNENGTILLAELENILSNLGKSRKKLPLITQPLQTICLILSDLDFNFNFYLR